MSRCGRGGEGGEGTRGEERRGEGWGGEGRGREGRRGEGTGGEEREGEEGREGRRGEERGGERIIISSHHTITPAPSSWTTHLLGNRDVVVHCIPPHVVLQEESERHGLAVRDLTSGTGARQQTKSMPVCGVRCVEYMCMFIYILLFNHVRKQAHLCTMI